MRAQWADFLARPAARLLVWRVADDESRMVDAFIELGNDERAGDAPEIFVPLRVPFVDPDRHGFALRDALIAGITEGEASPDPDPDPDAGDPWTPPPLARGEGDVAALVACCTSLVDHQEGALDRLVLVLASEGATDLAAFQLWLQRLAHRAPGSLRVLVLDTGEAPSFDALVAGEPDRVVSRALDLAMWTAMEEISAEAGGLDTPGGRFRHLMVKIGRAASANDHARAEALGAEAIAVMPEERSLVAAVYLTLGSMQLGASRHPEAIARFRKAEEAALAAEAAGDPAGRPLAVQTAVAVGSALIAGSAWEPAAEAFERAAARARIAGDLPLHVDCKRLVSFALEQAGSVDRAWIAGTEALAAGEALTAEQRLYSTLRYVGEGLLRLAQKGAGTAQTEAIEARMVKLLGPGWRGDAAGQESRR